MSNNADPPNLYALQAGLGAAQMLAEESRDIRDACRSKDPIRQQLWIRAAMTLIGRFRTCREEIESALPFLSKGVRRFRVAEVQARSAFQATLDVASISIKHLYCAINSSRDEQAWPTDSRVPERIEVNAMLDVLEPLVKRTAEWYVLMVREPENGDCASRVADLEQAGVLGPHLTPIIREAFRTKERRGKAAQWNGLFDQLRSEFAASFDDNCTESRNGAAYASHVAIIQGGDATDQLTLGESEPKSTIRALDKPNWNHSLRVLTFRGKTIRQYRRIARNQFEVLNKFQELGWVESILDPFPGLENTKRLQDVVEKFNKDREDTSFKLSTYHGGRGVSWSVQDTLEP